MKKAILLSLLCVLTAFSAKAQNAPKTEYGRPAELKGVTKIFIDTDGDTEERERMLTEFDKAKIPNLKILDSSDGAEVILYFNASKVAYNAGVVNNGSGSMNTQYRSAGKGIAFIPKGADTIRVLLSTQSVKNWAWNAKPSVKFARDFIEAYKEANGIK